MIISKFDNIYLCELKFNKIIDSEVIKEVKAKIQALKKPKYFSIRPVLIYAGELSEDVQYSDFFYKLINVKDMV